MATGRLSIRLPGPTLVPNVLRNSRRVRRGPRRAVSRLALTGVWDEEDSAICAVVGVKMPRRCSECTRTNPSEAGFCFYDGTPLADGAGTRPARAAPSTTASGPSPAPFVFPRGETCRNFLQLALACQRDPADGDRDDAAGLSRKVLRLAGPHRPGAWRRPRPSHPTGSAAWTTCWASCPAHRCSRRCSTSSRRRIDLGVLPVGQDRRIRPDADQQEGSVDLRQGGGGEQLPLAGAGRQRPAGKAVSVLRQDRRCRFTSWANACGRSTSRRRRRSRWNPTAATSRSSSR